MKLLVYGSRMRISYKDNVFKKLIKYDIPITIIEGCCKNSADEYAEQFAKEYHQNIEHYPSMSDHYLERNIAMVIKCDEVLAFWNGYSHGTAHTIAQAIKHGKKVEIVEI